MKEPKGWSSEIIVSIVIALILIISIAVGTVICHHGATQNNRASSLQTKPLGPFPSKPWR